jgi:hypothetical protein
MSEVPSPPETPAAARSLGAMLVGVVAGLVVFAGLIGGGLLLYQRTYGDSVFALLVILLIFGGFGAYLAWLVGVLVFSSVRPRQEGDET